MLFEKFKNSIHESWWSKLKLFIESEECDRIYGKLKELSKGGHYIAPLSSNVWRAFLETPYDELKVVMLGMCPYHTYKEGVPIADGLLMGCSITRYPQPSLSQFYNAIEEELYTGLNLEYYKNPDISYLAKQGVLMLNAALTTEKGLPGSHIELWTPFMKYLFNEVINGTNVPIIYLGVEAERVSIYSTSPWQFKLSHPASSSYKRTSWCSNGVFNQINKILKNSNNYEIQWLDVEK
jgi:uracil-DNA glycosylase